MRAATRMQQESTMSSSPKTLADLRRALDDKERELRLLLARRDELADDLEELGETLEAMLAGGTVAPGRAGRSPRGARAAKEPSAARGSKPARTKGTRLSRENSLPVVIRSVLERVVGPMRVAEIAEAAVKAGYASKSKNLAIIVANRLAQMEDVEKVERGLYQLKRSNEGPESTDSPASG